MNPSVQRITTAFMALFKGPLGLFPGGRSIRNQPTWFRWFHPPRLLGFGRNWNSVPMEM
jgi:hypothetical protein